MLTVSRQQEELIMLNFPPPPPPPIDSSQLENLAEYYRALVDYYRRASELASQQLTHVEALLHPNSELTFLSELDGWLSSPETQHPNGNRTLAIAEPIPQLLATGVKENGQKLNFPDFLESNTQPTEEIEEENKEESRTVITEETLLEVLATELESNRGKMLHLDYLVRKLHGEIDSRERDNATQETRMLLEKGTTQQRWFAVRDAPDCWTIDLGEFPDLTEQPTPLKRASYNLRITLVGSEILERYATISDAIAACLEEHYPKSMTTKQIADWFYPEGLSPSRRQKIHSSLGNALSAGCDKLWRRVRLGEYIWKK
jgi:hypothetical protein